MSVAVLLLHLYTFVACMRTALLPAPFVCSCVGRLLVIVG